MNKELKDRVLSSKWSLEEILGAGLQALESVERMNEYLHRTGYIEIQKKIQSEHEAIERAHEKIRGKKYDKYNRPRQIAELRKRGIL